jgi:light-regulated signal transduction histidine kinase (bacteriophytochrome)/CheY-like chemotaxis protein
MVEMSTPPTDLTNCDREPIHIPGAILPHGAMLVLDADTLEVLQAAGNLSSLLGVEIDALLGQSIETLFRPDQIHMLRRLSTTHPLVKPHHLLDPLMRVAADQPLDASVHRSAGDLVIEFEAADLLDRFASDPLAGVQEMVEGFDAPITLQALCALAAIRVRAVAKYDRVLVYRFMQDDSGWVIAESCEPHLEPFLDLHYPAADIPQQARALYVKNWLRLITQVNYDPAPLIPQNNPHTGKPLNMSQAILRDVSPIHREYLRNMGIDASMSISIVRKGKLWGLIACHNYSPRILPRHLRAVCELFGSMFSLQLEARDKGEQFEQRLASRMVLQNLMLNLASAEDYAQGLTKQSPNLLDYISIGNSLIDGSSQGGVAVSVKGALDFLGVTPNMEQIKALVIWLNDNKTKLRHGEGVYATDRLGEVYPDSVCYANVASGILFISVSDEPSDFIIWFRPELVGTTSWAGQTTKLAESGPDGDRLSPRKSFEIWKETIRGRSLQWTPADVDAAYDLRISLLHVVLRRINAVADERKRAADRDQLLMAELDHRVKNTIASIQALVRQTSQSAQTVTGFVEGLDGRIRSMAKAHSLLSQSRWESVSIKRLVQEELEPYQNTQSKITLSGSDLLLTPKSALSLSLAIHELATNAVKYGALSKAGGALAVKWDLTGEGIGIVWTETGGPKVLPPERRGFGSTLIERALSMETGGSATLHYLREGVVCEILLPNSSVTRVVSNNPMLIEDMVEVLQPVEPNPALPDKVRILIVEDSFLVLMSLEGFFADLGWTIVGPATRREAAVVMARSEQFDVALLDVNLDGEMSWDVAKVLQERGIPFVFSTGYDASNFLPESLSGSPILGKPFSEKELEVTLRKLLPQPENVQTEPLSRVPISE